MPLFVAETTLEGDDAAFALAEAMERMQPPALTAECYDVEGMAGLVRVVATFSLAPNEVMLAVLAEARMDDEVLTGAQIEAVISGRNEADCDEAAGATRVKRLRDALGNQLVSELLVKTIARRGYVLAVGKDALKMI